MQSGRTLPRGNPFLRRRAWVFDLGFRRRGPACAIALLAALVLTACNDEPKPPPISPDKYVDTSEVAPTSAPAAAVAPVRFTDIAAEAGLRFTHETGAFGKKWMPETMGSGGGFLDYDNDGRPDIFLVNGTHWPGHEKDGPRPTPKLFRNVDGRRFEDVTAAAGLAVSLYGMGAAMADYDGDGDTDIYVTAVGDNRLFRNDGGRFTDVTTEAGVARGAVHADGPGSAWSTGAAWIDADGDGQLDLFVCNYVQWTPETDLYTTLDGTHKSYATPQQYAGQSCVLFRNLGQGRFEDATKQAGLYNPEGKSMSVVPADLNLDGAVDLIVTNDTQPNFLYLGNGDGTFRDEGVIAGVAYDESGRARAGMGVDVADVTGTGRLAIAIGNFSREPISLYEMVAPPDPDADAQLPPSFVDAAGRRRLTQPSLLPLTFALLFCDFNLDGRPDMIAANGHIEPEINTVRKEVTFAQRPQVFLNTPRGRFVDASADAGDAFAKPVVGRGLAHADIDNDGDEDVLLTCNGQPPLLLRNDTPNAGHAMQIRLRGAAKNPAAIGAEIVVRTGEHTQRRRIRTGGSYLSQSDLLITFGLADAETADAVDVTWPDGKTESLGSLAADKRYEVTQGAGVTHTTALMR